MSIEGVGRINPYAPGLTSPGGALPSIASREGPLAGVSDLDILDPGLSRSEAIGSLGGATRALDPAGSPGGFGEVLAGALRDAVVAENSAVAKADALSRGENDDVHGTMISAKEADISLKLVGAVRNKLLDAFHELWRTNV